MKVSARYFVKQYWKDYALGIGFLLMTNLLAASIPLIIKQIIDALNHHEHQFALYQLCSIAVIIIVMFGVRVLSRYFLIGVGRKIEFETRMQLFRHILSMPRSFFDVQQTGDLMSRMINDLAALRMFLGGGFMLMGNVVFAYATVLPIMALLSWRLTLFSFLLYPFVIGLMRILSMRVKTLSFQVQERLGDLTAIAQENFSGISIIQSYAKEPEESARFYDGALGYFDANVALVKTRSLLYILIAMASGVSILIVLGEGGREVILKGLTLSGFTAFMLYLERLAWPTVSFGWILSTFQQGAAAQERINQLLEAKPEIADQDVDNSLSTIPTGPITVRNLWFRYDNPYAVNAHETPPWVLKNISFSIQPGQLVAIVGPIGAGKTTLLNLLVRLYNPPAGSIQINETPLEKISLAVLRRDITLMPQNAFLFSTTVQNNLAYVNPDHQFETISEMAETAHIHEEIIALPQSYQTVVGERGITLSGGQRQRSALARTLLVEPRILLLDDPFSNVDADTEEMIIQALKERRILSNKTTIFSSQRFSLVQQADWIIVLNESGEIDATGTHETLLQTSAQYRSLTKLDQPEGISTP